MRKPVCLPLQSALDAGIQYLSAAAILYEVTNNIDLARQFYQFFKHDNVSNWVDDFEINEHQVLAWLSTMGAIQVNVVETAKTEHEVFYQLFEKTHCLWRRASTAGQGHQVLEAIIPCAEAIELSREWLEKYKPHIQKLKPATGDSFEWKPMIEEIRNRLRGFKILLSYQQADKPLLETADQIIAESVELLENHIYLP